jgi:hypothetical protein
MTRAVVFLTATLLLASLGAVAQNNSNPSAGQSASVQTSAPAQNATQPAAPPSSTPANAAQGTATTPPSKGIQDSTQGAEPRTTSSAELPQTSTILPLLGLLGLGSLVAGLFARR